MIAVKRLQSLFWVLLVALGALGAYLVSLRVATERNELMRVRTQIAQARADIRYLETEFSARANMRQLERWNADDFRYSALAADHYLDGERALAHLDGIQPNGPAYVAPPVMVAMIDADDAQGEMQPAQPSPATLQIRSDAATIRAAQEESAPANAAMGARPRQAVMLASMSDAREMAALSGAAKKTTANGDRSAARSIDKPARADAPQSSGTIARRAERMAMLDARLLDERTLGELGRRAAAENGGKPR